MLFAPVYGARCGIWPLISCVQVFRSLIPPSFPLLEPLPCVSSFVLEITTPILTQKRNSQMSAAGLLSKLDTRTPNLILADQPESITPRALRLFYYYLAEYDKTLSFALGAGGLINLKRQNENSAEYIEAAVPKVVNRYTNCALQKRLACLKAKSTPRLITIIKRIHTTSPLPVPDDTALRLQPPALLSLLLRTRVS